MVVYLVCFSFLLSFVCSGDHNIILGMSLTYLGDGNYIKGDKNVQVGHSSLLAGNSNWNFGNNQKIEGDDILVVNGFQLIGDHNTNVNNLKRAEHKKLDGI